MKQNRLRRFSDPRRWKVALFSSATLLAVACGAGEDVGSAGSAGISAVDLVGERVELPGPAERVVAIPIPAASMIVAVNGGPDVLAGMNPSAKQALESGFLGEVFPELARVPSDVTTPAFVPDIEKLLMTNPDLVIQWGDRGDELIAPLHDAGLTVAQLQYGTQEFLEQAVDMYGALLGKQDRADHIIKRMHDGVASAKARTPVSSADPPKVVHVSAFQQGLEVAGGGSYSTFFINLIGAKNPADSLPGTGAKVNLEDILAWDPDVILLGNFDPVQPADIYADERWASITAVAERRVYKVPLGGYRWDPPSQESPLMWDWLAGLVHDRTIPADLGDSIGEYYEFLYGARPSSDQLATILNSEVNSGSVGYEN